MNNNEENDVVNNTANDEAVENEAQANEAASEDVEVQTETAAEPDVNWEVEAAKLAEQIVAYKDQAVRAQAEAQNVRRRAEQDVEKAHKFALEKFSKELLPILDSLEKAIEAEVASGNDATPLREGVEMTMSMFLSAVGKFQIEQIDPVGHPFDPQLHEAMSMVESPDAEPNTVIAAMQKGYTLSGRLIRPAMVVVSK